MLGEVVIILFIATTAASTAVVASAAEAQGRSITEVLFGELLRRRSYGGGLGWVCVDEERFQDTRFCAARRKQGHKPLEHCSRVPHLQNCDWVCDG